MKNIARNRYSFFASYGIRTLFANMAYLFGSIYVYKALGFWALIGWGALLQLAIMFTNIPLQHVISRHGTKRTLIGAVLLEIVALYLLGFQFNIFTLAPIAILYGISIGGRMVSANSMNAVVMEEEHYGRQGAWWNNILSVISMLAPLAATVIIRDTSFQMLFGILCGGFLLSLFPLFFYLEEQKQKKYDSPHLLENFRELWDEYNFRSDVFRLTTSFFDGEVSVVAVMLLLFLLYEKDITIFGWILTVSSILALVLRRMMGRRFDKGSVNVSPVAAGFNSGFWAIYLVFIQNPLLSTLARVGSNLAITAESFPWITQYSNNIKRYHNKHYASTSSFLPSLGAFLMYPLLVIIYLLSGQQLIMSLFILNFLSLLVPPLRYFFYNKQIRNQIEE